MAEFSQVLFLFSPKITTLRLPRPCPLCPQRPVFASKMSAVSVLDAGERTAFLRYIITIACRCSVVPWPTTLRWATPLGELSFQPNFENRFCKQRTVDLFPVGRADPAPLASNCFVCFHPTIVRSIWPGFHPGFPNG